MRKNLDGTPCRFFIEHWRILPKQNWVSSELALRRDVVAVFVIGSNSHGLCGLCNSLNGSRGIRVKVFVFRSYVSN